YIRNVRMCLENTRPSKAGSEDVETGHFRPSGSSRKTRFGNEIGANGLIVERPPYVTIAGQIIVMSELLG
ncbi:hypothetical protein, partial [Pseudomonas savastanoi]